MPYFFGSRQGDRVRVSEADAVHLARSLRARPGERIQVIERGAAREGTLLTVRLETVSARGVLGVVEDERPHRPEPGARITIGLAQLPASALEAALAQCTALGAERFVLLGARRSVVREAVVPPRKRERWATICREAAMLAGRVHVPEVVGPVPFEAVARAEDAVLLERDAPERLAAMDAPRDVALLIGPEGGWAPEEVAAAGRTARLGPRTLRAEHAAAAALAVALAARGDT